MSKNMPKNLRDISEAFRPEINFDTFTKAIFSFQFKKMGFDLEKVNGEGINHYHIRYTGLV